MTDLLTLLPPTKISLVDVDISSTSYRPLIGTRSSSSYQSFLFRALAIPERNTAIIDRIAKSFEAHNIVLVSTATIVSCELLERMAVVNETFSAEIFVFTSDAMSNKEKREDFMGRMNAAFERGNKILIIGTQAMWRICSEGVSWPILRHATCMHMIAPVSYNPLYRHADILRDPRKPEPEANTELVLYWDKACSVLRSPYRRILYQLWKETTIHGRNTVDMPSEIISRFKFKQEGL